MPNSQIQINEGTGKGIAHWERTKDVGTVQEQQVVLSEPFLAGYTVSVTTAITLATAGNHLLQLMAGANNHLILRRIQVWQLAVASAAQACVFQLLRLTTAGTGGTSYTPRKKDPADGVAEATAMANITGGSRGTESDILWTGVGYCFSAVPSVYVPLVDLDFRDDHSKAPRAASGGTLGIALKNITGVTTTPTVHIFAEIDEIAWS